MAFIFFILISWLDPTVDVKYDDIVVSRHLDYGDER